MKVIPWALLLIAIAVIVYLEKCNNVKVQATHIDTLERNTHAADSAQHVLDSANAVYAWKVIDSQGAVIVRLQDARDNDRARLESRGKQLVTVNDKYKQAVADKDAALQSIACDSLSHGYDLLVDQYIRLQEHSDSVEAKRIALQRYTAQALTNSQMALDRSHQANNQLDSLYHARIKLVPPVKRFGVGPVIGIGISDKVRPFVGVGVTWNLIRF